MSLVPTDRQYTNQFKQASKTNWPEGNVGDIQRLTLDVSFSVEETFSAANPLQVTNPSTLSLNSGTWGDLGFAQGQLASLEFLAIDLTNGTHMPNIRVFTVGIISGPNMQALNLQGTNPTQALNPLNDWYYPAQTMPYRDGDLEVRDCRIWVDTPQQGIHLNYSHVTNTQSLSGNVISFHDGTETGFRAEGTDENFVTPSNPNPAYPLNTPLPFTHTLTPFRSGMSIFTATVEYRGNTGIQYHYRVEIVYMFSPFYETILNYQNRAAPDSLLGAESLTDAFKIEGQPVYNNPNVKITNNPKHTRHDGNVGWFDENFNQLPNNFSVSNVTYTDLNGNPVGQLDYANPVILRATISGIDNLDYGLSKFQYGFQWFVLEENDYKKQPIPYHQITKISTGGQADQLNDVFPLSSLVNSPFPLNLREGYSDDGASMDASNIKFDKAANLTDVEMEVTFRPNAAFSALMDSKAENERQYFLWVSVGDHQPETNKSDRVSLRLDFNTMKTFVPPIGPYPGMVVDFLNHPQDETSTPNLCGVSIFSEDDLLTRATFRVDTVVSPTIPIPQKMGFGVLVQRDSDDFQYILDQNQADLTQFPNATQYNFDQPRDFKYGIGNSKNLFQVNYDAANDSGTEKGVLAWYGWKCRYESWIQRFPAPPQDFYLNTNEQNGLNQDWYDYYTTNGWKIYFFVDTYALLNGETVKYQNLKLFTIRDYDQNGTISTEIKYFRNNNGVHGVQLIGGVDPDTGNDLGVLISGELVFVEITYTSTGTPFGANQAALDAATYGVNRVEVDKGAGQKTLRQLSSIWNPENDNPMVGIPSETLAKLIYVSSSKIIVETMIDTNKLELANKYEITSRIGPK